jgi:SAM-dependent methyltransferase
MAIHPLLTNSVDFELRFCVEVLKLESLHLGYSDNQNDIIDSLDTLRIAQQRYTQSLLDWTPSDVYSIVDVGCGIGDVAFAFEKSGRIVQGISPEKNHAAMFKNTLPGSSFIHSKIEDYYPKHQVDMLLMSESNNYFSLKDGLDAAQRCVKPGGYILISGFYRKTDHPLINTNMVYTSDLERECTQRGITIIKTECTSHKILPSLRFTESLFRHYMLPTLHIVQDLLMGFSPIIRLLLKLFMRKSGGFLQTLSEWYDANLSEGFFTQNMAYHRFLLQLPTDKNQKV